MSSSGAPGPAGADFEKRLADADTTVASFEQDDKSLYRLVQTFLRANPTTIPTLVLVISILAFGLVAPRFLGPGALSTVLQQVTVVGIIAVAQTLVILTAGIDLSVGAILVVSSLVMGNLAVNLGLPVWIAVPIGMAVAAFMGWLNGVLVAVVKLPPFIVTLGTLSVFTADRKSVV